MAAVRFIENVNQKTFGSQDGITDGLRVLTIKENEKRRILAKYF